MNISIYLEFVSSVSLKFCHWFGSSRIGIRDVKNVGNLLLRKSLTWERQRWIFSGTFLKFP